MSKTSIEWSDFSWNPIRGTKGRHHCVRISEGCKHCYAATMNHRFKGPDYVKGADTPRLDEEALLQPSKWRKARRIFVCSMTDLFMDEHTDQMIDRVFASIAWARHHTYQILTKRSRRMREYVAGMAALSPQDRTRRLVSAMWVGRPLPDPAHVGSLEWPFPWVWLGVSAENQERADERIPDLLRTPAVIRFVSAEPLLGPIDFRGIAERHGNLEACCDWPGCDNCDGTGESWAMPLHWVIVGGESGPGARPMDVDWARDIKEQCQGGGVPVFVKQMGAGRSLHTSLGRGRHYTDGFDTFICRDSKGGDMAEWPADLRVREFPR